MFYISAFLFALCSIFTTYFFQTYVYSYVLFHTPYIDAPDHHSPAIGAPAIGVPTSSRPPSPEENQSPDLPVFSKASNSTAMVQLTMDRSLQMLRPNDYLVVGGMPDGNDGCWGYLHPRWTEGEAHPRGEEKDIEGYRDSVGVRRTQCVVEKSSSCIFLSFLVWVVVRICGPRWHHSGLQISEGREWGRTTGMSSEG